MLRKVMLSLFSSLLIILTGCTASSTKIPSEHVENTDSAEIQHMQSKDPTGSAGADDHLYATQPPEQTDGCESPYYLYLEKAAFTLTVLKADENGVYSQVVKRIKVSHGGNKTPAGKYVLGWRERWHAFSHGENGYARYAVIYNPINDPEGWSGLFIHGPMYHSMDPNDLWPEYYDGEKGIGGDNTQGCLRMTVDDAKFILNNCPQGTILEVVNGAPSGASSDPVPSRNGMLHDPTDTEALPYP